VQRNCFLSCFAGRTSWKYEAKFRCCSPWGFLQRSLCHSNTNKRFTNDSCNLPSRDNLCHSCLARAGEASFSQVGFLDAYSFVSESLATGSGKPCFFRHPHAHWPAITFSATIPSCKLSHVDPVYIFCCVADRNEGLSLQLQVPESVQTRCWSELQYLPRRDKNKNKVSISHAVCRAVLAWQASVRPAVLVTSFSRCHSGLHKPSYRDGALVNAFACRELDLPDVMLSISTLLCCSI